MTSKPKQLRITVLCEDIAHHRFIRRYLICRGVAKREITPFNRVISYNNTTVLENYQSLAKTHRSKANYQNIALVVMIDADNKTVEERLREFDKKLDPKKAELNHETRETHERIAIFVPNRNIETWVHYIIRRNASDCNEQDDYKKYYDKDDAPYKTAAETFAKNICPNGLPDDVPDSLHKACEELKRLGLDSEC